MKEQDLLSLNPAFPLPKSAPTEALGMGLSEETWPGDDRMPDPMSGLAVRELEHSLGLVSGLDRYSLAAFPALIYVGETDLATNARTEQRAAVSAARALALSEDLRRLSGVPSPDPIVAVVVSTGTSWRFFLAKSRYSVSDGWGTVSSDRDRREAGT